MSTELDSVTELCSVQDSWERVDIMERLSASDAAKLFAPRWESERARSLSEFQPLKAGSLMTPGYRRNYESPANLVRFRRTLDYLAPGERVFEIGIGIGYLAGMMLRDGEISAYHGIDIVESNVAGTRETLQANGLDGHGTAALGDLYEVSRQEVETFGADLVVCCEVLEHVPDPEAALKVLANALPDGTDLLISVPLLHRLESVWGHLAIFGCARIRAMVEAAGLHAHTVDTVDNTWVMILASRDPKPSAHAQRAARVAPDPTRDLEQPTTRPRAIHNVTPASRELLQSQWTKRLNRADVTPDGDSLVCAFDASNGSTGNCYGGVRFAVSGLRGLRLELRLDDVESVSELYVDFMAGKKRVGRWRWELSRSRPTANPATFTLRPALRGMHLKRGVVGDLTTADSVELFAQIAGDGKVRFTITRLGLII